MDLKKDFETKLLLAKQKDIKAIDWFIKEYNNLLTKESVINGYFDEDLYQELIHTLLNCIYKFKI